MTGIDIHPRADPRWVRWDWSLAFALVCFGVGIIAGIYLAVMLL